MFAEPGIKSSGGRTRKQMRRRFCWWKAISASAIWSRTVCKAKDMNCQGRATLQKLWVGWILTKADFYVSYKL